MDLQAMVNAINQSQSDMRAGYHLTYGQLVDALKSAPKDAKVDNRFKGIGSWRGSYIEIAVFSKERGLSAENEEFSGDWDNDRYAKGREENVVEVDKLPTNANELGGLLESIVGKDFVGYKGGNYEITRDKPLWLEKESNNCDSIAIIGLDDNLKFITKKMKD